MKTLARTLWLACLNWFLVITGFAYVDDMDIISATTLVNTIGEDLLKITTKRSRYVGRHITSNRGAYCDQISPTGT